MGSVSVKASRDLFKKNNIPAYSTPEAAVRAFAALGTYHDSQQQLLQVPEPVRRGSEPELDNAKLIIENAKTYAVEDDLLDQIFDFMVRDFSKYALQLYSKESSSEKQMAAVKTRQEPQPRGSCLFTTRKRGIKSLTGTA